MSKRRKRIVVLACAIAALGLIWGFRREREPAWNGHTLGYWLSVYAAGHYGWPHPEGKITNTRRDEAAEAVREIGPAAIPFLVKWIDYHPSKLKNQFVVVMGKLNGGALGWCIPDSFTWDHGVTRAGAAELGFALLGPTARDAVPPLTDIIGHLHDHAAAQRLLRALISVGPDAHAAIIPLLRENGLELDASQGGQNLGDSARVRIFPVEHIKGLEFEAVFYVGLDRMAEIHRDLIDKYVYVGLSRARSFLGVTFERHFPTRLESIKHHFDHGGSWGKCLSESIEQVTKA